MAVFHEKIDAVLLGCNGVGVGLGNALNNLEAFNIEFEAAGSALVGADLAGDDDAGFLSEALECLEDFGRDTLDVGDALDGSSAVTKDGKEQLAALP